MLQPFLLTALWPRLPNGGYGKCVEGSSNARWSRLVLMAWPRFTGSRRNRIRKSPLPSRQGLPGEAGEKQCVHVKGTLALPAARLLLRDRKRQLGRSHPEEQHGFCSFYPTPSRWGISGPSWPPLISFPQCGDSDKSSLLSRLQLPL